MNKKIIVGLAGGAALGYLSSTVASTAIHKSLVTKIDALDDEFENLLSKAQLVMKFDLERLTKDLELNNSGTPEYRVIELKVNKMKTDLLKTLRSNQLEVYNKLDASMALYRSKHKTTSIVLSILGGLAGGVLVAKLSE